MINFDTCEIKQLKCIIKLVKEVKEKIKIYIIEKINILHPIALLAMKIFLALALSYTIAAAIVYPYTCSGLYSGIKQLAISMALSETALILCTEGVVALFIGDIILKKTDTR